MRISDFCMDMEKGALLDFNLEDVIWDKRVIDKIVEDGRRFSNKELASLVWHSERSAEWLNKQLEIITRGNKELEEQFSYYKEEFSSVLNHFYNLREKDRLLVSDGKTTKEFRSYDDALDCCKSIDVHNMAFFNGNVIQYEAKFDDDFNIVVNIKMFHDIDYTYYFDYPVPLYNPYRKGDVVMDGDTELVICGDSEECDDPEIERDKSIAGHEVIDQYWWKSLDCVPYCSKAQYFGTVDDLEDTLPEDLEDDIGEVIQQQFEKWSKCDKKECNGECCKIALETSASYYCTDLKATDKSALKDNKSFKSALKEFFADLEDM